MDWTGLDWTGLYDGMMGESLEVVVRRSEFQKGTGGEGVVVKKKGQKKIQGQ